MSEVENEMSDADVASELQAAVAADAAAEQPTEAPPVVSSAPPAGAPEENVPVVEVQPPVEPEVTEPLVPFNPDELPEELLPAWKQLQAAWTPKLQEAAAIQRQFEQYGGADAVDQAAALYARIADPEQWPAIYQELSAAMEEYGYEFDGEQEQPAAPASPNFGDLDVNDPELAPIIARLQELEGTTQSQSEALEQFYMNQQASQMLADEELRQAQHLAQLQRQVVSIRQANPNYDDEDVKDIVRMAPFFNDDLALAHAAFEQSFARRMDRYYAGKKGAESPTHGSPMGAGVSSQEAPDEDITLEQVEAEAVEYMRRLQDAGDLDL